MVAMMADDDRHLKLIRGPKIDYIGDIER